MLRKLIFFAITSGLAKKVFDHYVRNKPAQSPALWTTVLKEQAANRDYKQALRKEPPTRSPLH